MKRLLYQCRIWIIKISSWEYWDSAIIYLPILPYLGFLWLKAKCAFFFTAANPGIEYGGFLMESKWKIHTGAPGGFFPATIFIDPFYNFHSKIEKVLQTLRFPLIAKPDIGSRGRGVSIIRDADQLRSYHEQCPVPYPIQEKVNYPKEAGIFYVRIPGENSGKITGIVIKEYITVTGNGKATLRKLLQSVPRYLLQLKSLETSLGCNAMEVIIPDGEAHTVIDIGNHARGAIFTDGSEQITAALNDTIDTLCKKIEGFYFGRLDVRFNDWKTLEKGEDFSVIELNGAGSEPTHIYDPSFTLLTAWKEICRHWLLIYKISRLNHKKGIAYLNWKEAILMFRKNAILNKKLALFKV